MTHMSETKRTTVILTVKQHKMLMSLASDRVSFSEHIRRAIDAYLAQAPVVTHEVKIDAGKERNENN